MVNAKTRNQWKARLESTEALTSLARDGKGEAEVQQAQVPSVVVSKRKKSRKRKLGIVLEEQESAAPGIVATQKDVQDCTPGKQIVHDGVSGAELTADSGVGTMGSSDPRAASHQRARRRGLYGAMGRTRDIQVDELAENKISPDITGKEAVVHYEEKKGKRKILGHNVRKQGKEKVVDVVSCHSRELNPNRKRRNLLHGLGAVSEDVVNLARPLTRGMVKPSSDSQTGTAHIKKRKRFRPKEAPIIAEKESPVVPMEEAAKGPNMDLAFNGSNVETSHKTAEFDHVLNTEVLASVESPADFSGLNHVSLQSEAQLSKSGRPTKHGKTMSKVHLVKQNRDTLPRPISPRVTRGMKDTGLDPAGIIKGSPLKGDPKSRSSNDEPLGEVVEPTTAIEAASMQLRSHKKVEENLNSAERPRKRVKKKQDKLSAENCQKVVDMTKPSDSMLERRTAISIEGLGVSNAATSDSQVNHTAPERNGNSSLNNRGGTQLSLTEGVHTNGSKMDGRSEIERQVDPGILPPASGLAMQCMEGGVEKKNIQDTSHTKECTEGDGRKGGRLGRMKKREKKKIDPGGGDSVQVKKASDPSRNVQQREKTQKRKVTKDCPQVGPGPSNESQPEPGKQGIDTQNLEGMTAVAAGKSQKPVELAEIRDETGVEKSVHLAEADGGCQEIDHHHLAPQTLLDESSNGEGNNLDTLAPREGPSKPVGVVTRGSDGRKSTGPANGSIKKKLKTKGNVGRWKTGRKAADSRVLLQNPKSHVEDRGVDSAHEKVVEASKHSLQDEQIYKHAQVKESSQLGPGTFGEVQMGLGDERVDVLGIEADTLEGAGMLKDSSELQNVRFVEKVGVEKAVGLTETDGGGKQVQPHDQPDEGNDDGVKHSETVITRKLPERRMGVLTRGRKVDLQFGSESKMESGLERRLSSHSDQPRKRWRRKIGVGKDNGSEVESTDLVETIAHIEVSNDRRAKFVDSLGLSTNSECEAEKGGIEAILDKKTGEGETVEAARTMENRIELEDRGSEEEKGTELPVKLAEEEGGCKDNYHDQSLEKRSVETHNLRLGKNFVNVNFEQNPTRRIRRKGSVRVGEKEVPAKDSSLLKSTMGLIDLDMETVVADPEQSVVMLGKRKRKKQATGTDGDDDTRKIAEPESVASGRVTLQRLEAANKPSPDGKGRRGMRKEVKKAIAADSQPSFENTELVLPIEVGSVAEEAHFGGSCNGDQNGQEELSKGSLVPERRKTGRSHGVRPTSMVTEGNSEVVPEVGYCITITELSSGQGVDSDVVQSEGCGGQRSVLDDIVNVIPEALQVGLPTVDGNAPDQGEHSSCDLEGGQKLPKDLSEPIDCNSGRSKMVSFTTLTGDDSTFKETSEEVNLTDSANGREVTADIVQSVHDEGRAEPLTVAVEVTQNPLQVNSELALQSLEAQSGPHLDQGPVRKKKVRRRKNYGCGIEFQRITRARDNTGKSVPNIESQGSKNGTVADAVSVEHVERRAEGFVSTTDKSKDSLCLEEMDTGKEDGKSLLDVSDLLVKSASALSKDDISGATNEQEKEVVKVMEGQKSLVRESSATGGLSAQEAENGGEPISIPSSILKDFEESKTVTQGELNGEQNDQQASSTVSLTDCQQENIIVPELFSKLPDSPDGPFALEDGKSLTLHCGQEKASNLDDGGLDLEVSHPSCLETIGAQDFNHFGVALEAYSISMPDKSESLTVVKTSDPVASVDKSCPVATIVESDIVAMVELSPVATSVVSDPVAAVVESDPVATTVESDPIVTMVNSDPVAAIVESDPIASVVESDPVASVVESDPVASVVESDPVASVVESDPVATIVESDAVATTIASDPVTFTVGSDYVGTMVDSDPGATIVESDPFNAAEGVHLITTSDSSNVDTLYSITTENMFDAFPAVCKPEGVAAVADSVTTVVTTASNAVSIATVESSSVPTDVLSKENTTRHLLLNGMACEIGSGREFAVGSERTIEECLITEAVNSRDEQVTLDAPLEDFELNEENSIKSPLLEGEGCQLNLSGKVADSSQLRYPTPVEDSVRQPTAEVEVSLPEVCASSEPWTREKESTTEPEPCTSLRGGACVELVSSDYPQLDLTDQTCTKVSSDVVELGRFAAHRTPQEGSRLLSLEHSVLNQMAECGVDLSCNGAQKSFCFGAGDRPVGTEQVVTSLSVKPIAVDRNEGSVTSRTSRSSLDDVAVDDESLKEKLASAVEDLEQTKLEGQEPDEPILKDVDVEFEDRIEVHDETKNENSKVWEVHVKACSIHTESTKVQSITGELRTDGVGVHSEANQVNLDGEGVNLVGRTVQAEVHEMQIEAQLLDGAEGLDPISLNGDAEYVNAVTEGKQLETEAKEIHVGANEVHSELDWRAEVNEVDAQQEVDAEAIDTVADEVTNKNEPIAERVLGLDNLDTLSTLQPPPSNNLVPGCDSLVPATGQAMSVPERDISRPVSYNSRLDQQTRPIEEPVTLDTDKHVHVDKEEVHTQSNQQDTVQYVQSTSPLEASRCLEGDVLHPELSDIQTETHEKDDSKAQTLRSEDPVQLNQQDAVQSVQLTFPLEASRCLEGDVLHPEELSDIQMETHEKEDAKTQSSRLEDPVSQRNMAGVKGSLVSKKRKGRTGIETPKEPECVVRAEEAPSRVYSKRKGFLLTSTTIESGGMRIRPRPLDPDQSIPILVEGRDKDFHDYDGGSFYRWVQQQEEAKLKKPATLPVADGVSEGGGLSNVSRTDAVKKRTIFIPLFRKLPDDKRINGRIVTRPDQDVLLGMESPFPRPHAYLQHTNPAAKNLGHALGGSFCTVPSVYDMDDEDEEWLQAYNEILKHSGTDQLLSEDTFEQLMELFEREFYRICQISDKSLPVLTRNLGEKGGASGRRGKRLVMDSSQRPCRLEANKDGTKFLKSMEIFQGALSQKEMERRFAVQNRSDDCCICNGGENSDSNPVRRCQICSIQVHESCYGICATTGNEFGYHAGSPNWRCRKCEAVVGGTALPSISCAICCKSGGAMKPTVDPLKWAHVACALYTNETFFIDTEAMEPVDGLAAVETRVKKQRERCGLCGAREGSCVRCSTRGCRTPFHISCGVSQGASFELRHTKQQVEGIRSFCPHHATFVPGTNMDEIHHAPSKTDDAGDPLPAVSTESSDTLEMRHVERGSVGDEGNGTEDAIMNGAGWQGSFSNQTKLHRSESKRYFRKSRRGISAGGATPSKLDPNTSPCEVAEKDLHGVSRTLPRSGSVLKENMQGVSQYMDETDPYVHPSDPERLESEAVSAATSASSSHLTTFETVDHAGKATSNVDELDPVILAAKVKSVARDAYIADALLLKFPSLDALDTNLAPIPIVKAVYSFWQVKRVKAKGPILHDLRQLQVARSRGIFNKIVHRNTDFLPPVVHDSPGRMPTTRRPRSLSRDPVFSKFSEVRQQLEILRSIASNVVRREQMKFEDQKLIYESVQQQLLIARETPRSRRCLWCENTQNLLNCSSCPKAFCFQCFKHRRGYGVKGWIAASKLSKYVCNFCLGSIAQERGWPELSTNFSEPRGTAASRLALAPGRGGDWNHGSEVRTKPNSGRQVSFLNETSCNPYGSSSSPQEAASTMAPGRGKMMYTGRPFDVHAVHPKFAVPCANDRSVALDTAYHRGVASAGPNDPAGDESREKLDHPNVEGKKVKRRRAKVVNKQVEPTTVLRATKRIKKLARSSSFVYGSEDETTVSENGESPIDKRTVKLSDLRDKDGESQCTNLLEVGAEDKAEKGHPPLKFGIKFSPTGKLIVRRHGPPQLP